MREIIPSTLWKRNDLERKQSFPTSDDYHKWTVKQLKDEAKFRHLKKYSKKNKKDLITALQDTETPSPSSKWKCYPHVPVDTEAEGEGDKINYGVLEQKENPNLIIKRNLLLAINGVLEWIMEFQDFVDVEPPPNCPKEYRNGEWCRSISMQLLHWKCDRCHLWFELPARLNYRCLYEHQRRCKGKIGISLKIKILIIFLAVLVLSKT